MATYQQCKTCRTDTREGDLTQGVCPDCQPTNKTPALLYVSIHTSPEGNTDTRVHTTADNMLDYCASSEAESAEKILLYKAFHLFYATDPAELKRLPEKEHINDEYIITDDDGQVQQYVETLEDAQEFLREELRGFKWPASIYHSVYQTTAKTERQAT